MNDTLVIASLIASLACLISGIALGIHIGGMLSDRTWRKELKPLVDAGIAKFVGC